MERNTRVIVAENVTTNTIKHGVPKRGIDIKIYKKSGGTIG